VSVIEQLQVQLRTARQWTNSLLADIAESEWFTPPRAGLGHAAWQVGHLAVSQVALVHGRCFGKAMSDHLPESYKALFGRGSTPVAEQAKYPPIAEIRSAFDRVQAESLQLVGRMSEADLSAATIGDPHPLFSTKGGAAAMAAMHETFHAGQIAMIRRFAGKSPLR
jgi:hypothetical protein